MNQKTLAEDAASGTTSSGSIASNTDRRGHRDNYALHRAVKAKQDAKSSGSDDSKLSDTAKANLAKAKEKLRKKKTITGRFKSFLGREGVEKVYQTPFRLNENFNMQDIVSRLKGIEHKSNPDPTISYGVEDDKGNMMKVTVKSEDSKDFEASLASHLANAKDYKDVTGDDKDMSMAELLFKLKDEFEIIDVQFPTIPKDAIYNADKVSYGAQTPVDNMGGDPMAGGDGMDAGMGNEMGTDPNADPMGGGGMDAGMDAPMGGADPLAADGQAGEGGEGDLGGMGGEDDLGLDGDDMMDDESVQEFGDESEPESETSMMVAVLSMLKADAEARTAQANAEAEKARALQAEYAAQAAQSALGREEEFARMDTEMEAQKEKEKEAKRIADLARFRVNSMPREGFTGTLIGFLAESSQFDTPANLMKQKQAILAKYAPTPGDDPETVQFKRQMGQLAKREVDTQIRMATLSQQFAKKREQQQKQQPQQPQQPNQPQNGQPQQANQPQQPQNGQPQQQQNGAV